MNNVNSRWDCNIFALILILIHARIVKIVLVFVESRLFVSEWCMLVSLNL